jgi:hypothetical protein
MSNRAAFPLLFKVTSPSRFLIVNAQQDKAAAE